MAFHAAYGYYCSGSNKDYNQSLFPSAPYREQTYGFWESLTHFPSASDQTAGGEVKHCHSSMRRSEEMFSKQNELINRAKIFK